MPKKLAYADPPYLGQAHRYPEKTEVDHEKLLGQLQEYDGWALSCSSPSLKILLPMAPPETRVAAWVKPFAIFKPNVNPAYAWEPILFKSARPNRRDIPTVRDWVSCNITLKKGLVGAKPHDFCWWLFNLIGAERGDTFNDMFPGTGIVTQTWNEFCAQESANSAR